MKQNLFLNKTKDAELFIGLIGPIGTDLDDVIKHITSILKSFQYNVKTINLIGLLEVYPVYKKEFKKKGIERYLGRINAGNDFRKKLDRNEALALLGIADIRKFRLENNSKDKKVKEEDQEKTPLNRYAYILKSLKRPEEVELLREIYGESFYLISVYSKKGNRKKYLDKKFKSDLKEFTENYEASAERLIEQDEKEKNEFGQDIIESFPNGDLFINLDNQKESKESLTKFFDLIFGRNIHTPNLHEYFMFYAKAASLRSGSLARQVGAVICDKKGDIIAVGTNEVPKSGGGQYWAGDNFDARDITKEFDASDDLRLRMFQNILQKLKDMDLLNQNIKTDEDIEKILTEDVTYKELRKTQIPNILEFGRAVHAEMGALMEALRQGRSVKETIMYVTTFPCHECSRHIVASGIKKVYYIEPYPKSLVNLLHDDSISIEEQVEHKVIFKPYVGISPNKFIRFFSVKNRKDRKGKMLPYDHEKSNPAISESQWNYIPK